MSATQVSLAFRFGANFHAIVQSMCPAKSKLVHAIGLDKCYVSITATLGAALDARADLGLLNTSTASGVGEYVGQEA
eukprot:6468092-Amphidinium_carterae.2